MKIGQFTESFLPIVDGVGRVVYNYANGLAKCGDECYVVAPQTDTGYRGGYPFELCDYSATSLPGSPQYKSGLAVLDKHYVDRMDKVKLDICHAHTPFFAGQEALRLCSKHGMPLVGTFHSKYYDDFYKATHMELLANMGVKFVVDFYERCDEVWTVSESSAGVLREYGYTGDIVVMENGTELRPALEDDRKQAIERFHLDTQHPIFLFVGQINWKKGILRLLEAAAYLRSQGERFTLVLAGQGPDEEAIRAKAAEMNISDAIIFTGHLGDTHLLDGLYQAATLFTFPSLYDTFSLVVREAAAMYTPSVVTVDSAAAEPIRHGINGLICPDDGERLGMLLKEYMHNDSALRAMGQSAHDTIPHDWDNVIRKSRERYAALIERNGTTEMAARRAGLKDKLVERREKLAAYFGLKM